MSKRILVVEDDSALLEAMKLLLTSAGYDVVAVKDGTLALQHIISYKPTLVFLDMLMSGVDGRELCAAIKKDPRSASVYAVMVSAYPDAESIVTVYGADDFLAKPFEVQDFLHLAAKYTRG